MAELSLFYEDLDPETRRVVEDENHLLDQHMAEGTKRWAMAGQNLARIRDALRYKRPGFVDYLASKGIPTTTAYNLINMGKMFPDSGNIQSVEALKILAAPSTPEVAREEARALAGEGQEITHTRAKEIVSQHKAPKPKRKEPKPAPLLLEVWQLERSVSAWLNDPDEPMELEEQIEVLEAVKANDDIGKWHLEHINNSILGSFRPGELRQACNNVLEQLKQQIARKERIAGLECPDCHEVGRMVEKGLGTIHCEGCEAAWSSVEAVVEAMKEAGAASLCEACGKDISKMTRIPDLPYCGDCWTKMIDHLPCPGCGLVNAVEKSIPGDQAVACWSCKKAYNKWAWADQIELPQPDEQAESVMCPKCDQVIFPEQDMVPGGRRIVCDACKTVFASYERLMERVAKKEAESLAPLAPLAPQRGESEEEDIPERSFGDWASTAAGPGRESTDAAPLATAATLDPQMGEAKEEDAPAGTKPQGEFDCPRCGLEKVVKTNGGAWCLACEAKWEKVSDFKASLNRSEVKKGSRAYRDRLIGRLLELQGLIEECSTDSLGDIEDWLDAIEAAFGVPVSWSVIDMEGK